MFIRSQGLLSFSLPASEQAGGAREVVRGHRQHSWPQLTKGLSHTMEHYAQYINWEKLARRCLSLLRAGLGISQWMVNYCFAHHLGFFSLFYFSLSCRLSFHYNYYYCYNFYILFQLLNCFYLNPWVLPSFQFSSPSHRRKRWASGRTVPNCQLGLNHEKRANRTQHYNINQIFLSIPAFHHLSFADYSLSYWLLV